MALTERTYPSTIRVELDHTGATQRREIHERTDTLRDGEVIATSERRVDNLDAAAFAAAVTEQYAAAVTQIDTLEAEKAAAESARDAAVAAKESADTAHAAALDAKAAEIETLRAQIEALRNPPEPELTLTEYASLKRWERETGGIMVGELPVPTSDRAKLLIFGAASALAPDDSAPFIVSGVNRGVFTGEQFQQLHAMIVRHVQDTFRRLAEVLGGIESGAITSRDEIDRAFA